MWWWEQDETNPGIEIGSASKELVLKNPVQTENW